MDRFEKKKEALLKAMGQYTKEDTAIAFSGGADSSLLLKLACECSKKNKTKVYAMTIQTELHTANDLENAKIVAKETDSIHSVLYVDELEEAGIEYNPVDRCYRCKKLLFTRIKESAEVLSVSCILEGTNADDLHVYRPGLRAIHELDVKSPLADAGLTKQEVRNLAVQYGISAAKRAANPCMATRFPYGVKLTKEAMEKAEQGELFLRSMGFYNVRLRVHNEMARLEIEVQDFVRIMELREEITARLKMLGYRYITLDMEGFRSGSMDENNPQLSSL